MKGSECQAKNNRLHHMGNGETFKQKLKKKYSTAELWRKDELLRD